MMNTLGQLHHTIGGTLKRPAGASGEAAATPLGRVKTDSRQVEAGDLFWALVGPHHDGADFAGEAFARGADGAVVGRPVPAPADRWLLTVSDTRQALCRWAEWRRSQCSGTLIAVTGSVGKTTTREMIHTVLRNRLAGTASPRNYNNHVGLPLSMLRIEPDHDYAVLELGASRRGEIAAVAGLCAPRFGVITSIGDAHLGTFGSRRAIAEAKAELLDALPPDGHAFLADEPWLRRVAVRCQVPITWLGRSPDCGLTATDVQWSEGALRFRLLSVPFSVPVWGRHHLNSALLAAAVGQRMGLGLEEIADALRGYKPPAMRCEVTRLGGVTVINDAYNASPAAMRAALELLRDVPTPGRKILVSGDMGELGCESAALHRRLGDQAVTLGRVDVLIACGEFAPHVVAGAGAAGMPSHQSVACRTAEETIPRLHRTLSPGDVVLVKGSRAMAMERVVSGLDKLASSSIESVGFAGTRRCPPSWGRSIKLAGSCGSWVGRPGKCFSMGLYTDRRGGAQTAPFPAGQGCGSG